MRLKWRWGSCLGLGSLKGRLLLGLTATWLAVLLGVLTFGWQLGRDLVQELNGTHLRYEARLIADDLSAEIDKRLSALENATVRANVMNVPSRVVSQLIGETDEARFKEVLAAELVQALESAAEADIELEEEGEGDDGDD